MGNCGKHLIDCKKCPHICLSLSLICLSLCVFELLKSHDKSTSPLQSVLDFWVALGDPMHHNWNGAFECFGSLSSVQLPPNGNKPRLLCWWMRDHIEEGSISPAKLPKPASLYCQMVTSPPDDHKSMHKPSGNQLILATSGKASS